MAAGRTALNPGAAVGMAEVGAEAQLASAASRKLVTAVEKRYGRQKAYYVKLAWFIGGMLLVVAFAVWRFTR